MKHFYARKDIGVFQDLSELWYFSSHTLFEFMFGSSFKLTDENIHRMSQKYNTFRMIETVTFGSWKPVAFFSIDHTCARGDSFLWSSKGFSGILGCYWGTYLTHDSTKGPETKTGGDHEEGDADEEEFVCHCQIKDVQIGDRLHFGVAQYNVDHQGVAH